MRNKAELITPDGVRTAIAPANGKDFQLDELYKAIGCRSIEVVPLSNEMIMIADEECKLTANPLLNPTATVLANIAGVNDTICGTVILCPTELLT